MAYYCKSCHKRGGGESVLVISNFWHQVNNVGGQISTDGLNYDYFGFPDRDSNPDMMEVDLNFVDADLGVEWDFTKPHKEMRSFPVPSGGLYFLQVCPLQMLQ